ncbi:MAG: U32 family peptidase [Mailhella sp.]|nr:U32 family peptidase [Mailhella sp.]
MIEKALPEVLAPAGDKSCFLAALAAGADAAYVGLKNFSARAGAENFSIADIAAMVDLANQHGRRVYVAFNSLLKEADLGAAGRLIYRLQRDAQPHALIIQDIGLIDIARQAGYTGELYMSTLSNIASIQDVRAAHALGIRRVVLPRELSIDEIRLMDQEAPEDMSFEIFIHGALCWCVSGRCYWSSYLGGKSGLRGRCVQPCRRMYQQKGNEGRFFSCQDLSLDVLVKTLAEIPHVRSLKIEGRKKGPHYVYHTAAAYRLLLDSLGTEDWPRAKKDAESLLEMTLGRPMTRARFLPQKNAEISAPQASMSSGLFVGKIQFEKNAASTLPFIKPRQELLPKDLLRVGYEDEPWHDTVPVTRRIPKAGTCRLKLAKSKFPKAGVPVFLIDRREPALMDILKDWEGKLDACRKVHSLSVDWTPSLPKHRSTMKRLPDQFVAASVPQGRETRSSRTVVTGLWMSMNSVAAVSKTVMPHICWWLPPVIWPEETESWMRLILRARRAGSSMFVCNAPWQHAFFPSAASLPDVHLTAGPFCNVANPASVALLARMGFEAAFASPELSSEDYLALPKKSVLPLGMVLSGYWPVGISRFGLNQVKPNMPFFSPKGEAFWARNYGSNLWIYPAWPLDISAHKKELEAAGYAFFARLDENLPRTMPPVRRTSSFNWDGALL